MTKTCLLFALFLFPIAGIAQYSVSGKIQGQNTGKPVTHASVYLAGTTIGSESAEDGSFTLKNIEPGKYELIISVVGFEAWRQKIQVANSNLVLPPISLAPKVNILREVTVKFDKHRNENIELFRDEFLGVSEFAKQCELVNPEVLNLDYDEKTSTLTASTDDYLVIKNKALGYQLKYLLADFKLVNKDPLNKSFSYHGTVFFREMDGTPDQQEEWRKNREQVYANSLMHFLRAALNNRLAEEGFQAYRIAFVPNPQRPGDNVINRKVAFFRDSRNQAGRWKDSLAYWMRKSKLSYGSQKLVAVPIAKEDIISGTNQPGIYSLNCDFDGLYISYNKRRQFTTGRNFDMPVADATVLNFKTASALFNSNGWLIDPNSVELTGAWTGKRLAETLPSDYQPEEAKADYTVFNKIAEKLKSFTADHPTEKVYLHFDKPYYAASDTMYFEAYVTGEDNRLSPLSGVLHVCLVNPDNRVQQSINLRLINGLAMGDFALPDTLLSEPYRVMAYTRLSADSANKGMFSRVIPVIAQGNTPLPNAKRPAVTDNSIDLQFFPEGGDLVSGLRSKVAFKAISADGLGINVKGVIVDGDDKEVASFNSTHLGMGYFSLLPTAGKSYKAKVTGANGINYRFKLPPVRDNGITLGIIDNPARITVIVKANREFYRGNKDRDFTLLFSSGIEIVPYVFKLTEGGYTIDLEKKQFRTGITRVTLFSPDGRPINERLVFIRNKGMLNLRLSADKRQYITREKVIIGINAADLAGKQSSGHFSVSVIDESAVPFDEESRQNIFTDLLLTQDLTGYVEKPNYYFTADPVETQKNLDLLMLTQGYRRFEWKQVLDYKQEPALTPQPELLPVVEGIVKNSAGSPVAGAEVVLVDTPDSLVKTTQSDASGRFKFADLNVTGRPLVLLSAKKANSKELFKLEISQSLFSLLVPENDTQASGEISSQPANTAQHWDQYKKRPGAISLKEVSIKGEVRAAPKLVHSSNRNISGESDYILMGNQLVQCTDLPCLFGRFPGTISKDGKLYLTRTGDRLGENQGFPPPPVAFILDGVLLSSQQYLFDMVNINDIYSIELLKNGAFLTMYGSSAPGGALIITTKRGDYGQKPVPLKTGVVLMPVNGFHLSRQFYSPKYERAGPGNDMPDLRSTIFWAPEVRTDKDGAGEVEYYNADSKGKYKVIIEGIDDAGNIGSQTFTYEVQ